MTIYQLFCGRQAEANIIDHPGKVLSLMADWEWSIFKSAGFSHIYLLGVIDHRGPITVTCEQDKLIDKSAYRTPSVFAINNHREIDPSLGTAEEMAKLIKIIQTAGLKVLVDFVPNQTGLNHEWVRHQPQYYKQNDFGEPLRAFSFDVLMLDHDQEPVAKDLSATLNWIQQLGADGVRCDMAHLSQPGLWSRLIPETKKVSPEFLFIAEGYSPSVFDWSPINKLIESGFDAVYHEFLYRNIKRAVSPPINLADLAGHIAYTLGLNMADKLVHYVSNHDDAAVNPSSGLSEPLLTLLLLLPGHLLVFNGSLNGRDQRLAHHWAEILPKEVFEYEKIPVWFKNAAKIKEALEIKINMINLDKPDVFSAGFETQLIRGRLIGNLSQNELEIDESAEGPGLLHGLSRGDRLAVNQAEVWLEPFSHLTDSGTKIA